MFISGYFRSVTVRYKLGKSRHSMFKTLPPNVRFLVIPDQENSHYEKGDILVFHDITPSGSHIVKRVVGLPGEDILIDGQEHYLGPSEYFVLGEQETSKLNYEPYDSRYFGPVPKSHIIGKAWFIYWPLGRIGRIS